MIKVARKAAIVKRAWEFVERQRGLATVGGEVTISAASLALLTVQDGRTEGAVPRERQTKRRKSKVMVGSNCEKTPSLPLSK